MEKFGFLYDPAVCTGCASCVYACREENKLPSGRNFRRVLRSEAMDGHGYAGFFSAGCNHCEEPACVKACPTGAMYRDEERGIVLHDDARCIGCSSCVWACPYGAVSIDPVTGRSGKCTSCVQRRENGERPACVSACPTGALCCGRIEENEAKGGACPDTAILPDGGSTKPSLRVIRRGGDAHEK